MMQRPIPRDSRTPPDRPPKSIEAPATTPEPHDDPGGPLCRISYTRQSSDPRDLLWRDVSDELIGRLLAAALRHVERVAEHEWLPILVVEVLSYGRASDGSDRPYYLMIGQGSPLRLPSVAVRVRIADGGPGYLIRSGPPRLDTGAWVIDVERREIWPTAGGNGAAARGQWIEGRVTRPVHPERLVLDRGAR